MRKRYETFVDVDANGKPGWYDATLVQQFLAQYPGKRFKVNFQLVAQDKSNPLMRYYWGAVVPWFQRELRDCGKIFSPAECSDFILKFCPIMRNEIHLPNGTTEYELCRLSDSDFDNGVFLQLLVELRIFAQDTFQRVFPEPNERPDQWNV